MIDSTIDHVAIAVPDRAPAIERYLGVVGGGSVASGRRAGITIDQIAFSRGTKLEVVGPDPESPDRGRTDDFLARFGSVVHHVTVMVESVEDSVAALRSAGVRPVGVKLDDPRYREAFVLPQQGGGVMVQLSWKDVDDEGWALRYGHQPTKPRSDCPDFIGARWSQPDLDLVATQWKILGGTVSGNSEKLSVSWGENRLRFEYVRGEPRQVEELLFDSAVVFSASSECGPATARASRT
jgi:hypothetical protein